MESSENNNENVENAINENTEKLTKEQAIDLLGITEERSLELKDIMLQIADSLKEKKLPLSIPTIVNEAADRVDNIREGLFVGMIYGQSLASMENPMVSFMGLLMKAARARG